MNTQQQPTVSVVIPVYNSWSTLRRCIASLQHQKPGPHEIIIVNDGSTIEDDNTYDRDADIIRIQSDHHGASTARNLGLKTVTGDIVLFLDSDCYLEDGAFAELMSTISHFPTDQSFQLRITGDSRRLVGAVEDLHLSAVQKVRTRHDGRINYLNTSAFAIRTQFARRTGQLFDPDAQRGEDTLLLAQQLRFGRAPRYIAQSIAIHSPAISISDYIIKAYLSEKQSAYAYAKVAASNVKVFSNGCDRYRILITICARAARTPFGLAALPVLALRHCLSRISRILCHLNNVHSSENYSATR